VSTTQSAMLTDLYQLTMLQAYFDEGMHETAVFEFFVRALPPGRNFLLAAGLEQVLCSKKHVTDWLGAALSVRFCSDSVNDRRWPGPSKRRPSLNGRNRCTAAKVEQRIKTRLG